MGLYSSITKKGSINGAPGEITCEPFECDKSVDKLKRAFKIQLIDDTSGKKHCIYLYGDEVIMLYERLNDFVKKLKQ